LRTITITIGHCALVNLEARRAGTVEGIGVWKFARENVRATLDSYSASRGARATACTAPLTLVLAVRAVTVLSVFFAIRWNFPAIITCECSIG